MDVVCDLVHVLCGVELPTQYAIFECFSLFVIVLQYNVFPEKQRLKQ